MPYLAIRTNQVIDENKRGAVLAKASRLVAQTLSKPEEYVMVALQPSSAIIFAANTAPAAFLELHAIDLPPGKTGELSRTLCQFAKSELGIPSDRIFINFADVPANLWGWNGDTF